MRQPLTCLALVASSTLWSLCATAQSHEGHDHNGRPVPYCSTPDPHAFSNPNQQFLPPSDCGLNSDTADPAYDPYLVYEIPVVWHVIHRTDNVGNISNGTISLQMQMLNVDFRPSGAQLGLDTKIRFVMASEDPQGNPTNGITRTADNVWFGDNGNYSSALNWDPNRYLNIYTLGLGAGSIGYVPGFPQNGIAGTSDDGVRMVYSAIASSDYNHVLSHEIGHHLGLYHTFQGQSCANTNCQSQGDLLCDTDPQDDVVWNCVASSGNCPGFGLNLHNYMNYQNVECVYEFTPDQIRRMRCTLENWRPNMWDYAVVGTNYCDPAAANSTGAPGRLKVQGSTVAADNFMSLTAYSLPPNEFGFFLNGTHNGVLANPGGAAGDLCLLGGSIGRYNQIPQIFLSGTQGIGTLELDLTQTPTHTQPAPVMAGQTLNFQAWYRDTPNATSNFTNAVSITFQ